MKAIHMAWGLAGTALLVLGLFVGSSMSRVGQEPAADSSAGNPGQGDLRPAFALMLYEDAAYQAPVDESGHAARVEEYTAWARKLASQGHFVDGAELLTPGILLRRDRPRTEGVPRGTAGMLAGYFVIRAATLEEAERLAAECPHLAYGGTVSVRPIGV